MRLDPSLGGHIDVKYYEAGHMMYIRVPSLEKMRGDLLSFIESATH